jgi:putative phosphoribosyl transferase
MNTTIHRVVESEVKIPCGTVVLPGLLRRPPHAEGLVVFAHGSGSNRHSSRNDFVARELNHRNLATLLFDLLTPGEAANGSRDGPRFDIPLLTERLLGATRWAMERECLPTGYLQLWCAGHGPLHRGAEQFSGQRCRDGRHR